VSRRSIAICLNWDCKGNFYLSSGIVDKSTTADENTTSKPVDEDANVIVMNELGLLGGENKVRPRLLRLLKKLRPGNQPY
jgi:hypothetical protein